VRRVVALVATAGALGGAGAALLPAASQASTAAKAKTCVIVPLPKPFPPGWQIQVGYCP
jgi:hypothetical protein